MATTHEVKVESMRYTNPTPNTQPISHSTSSLRNHLLSPSQEHSSMAEQQPPYRRPRLSEGAKQVPQRRSSADVMGPHFTFRPTARPFSTADSHTVHPALIERHGTDNGGFGYSNPLAILRQETQTRPSQFRLQPYSLAQTQPQRLNGPTTSAQPDFLNANFAVPSSYLSLADTNNAPRTSPYLLPPTIRDGSEAQPKAAPRKSPMEVGKKPSRASSDKAMPKNKQRATRGGRGVRGNRIGRPPLKNSSRRKASADPEYKPTPELPNVSSRGRKPTHPSAEVLSRETTVEDESEVDRPSSRTNLRSARSSFAEPVQDKIDRQDRPYMSIENQEVGAFSIGGRGRNRVVYDPEDDDFAINDTAEATMAVGEAPAISKPQTNQPNDLGYLVPAKLVGVRQAMGPDWTEYLRIMQQFVEGNIDVETLIHQERKLFQVVDLKLRAKIRKDVNKMVVDGVAPRGD